LFHKHLNFMTTDEKNMRIALRLGNKGLGRTSPNPPVGAVIVKDGKIIGKGWHKKAGLPHAEIEAIEDAYRNGYRSFSGATIYVTLEPCCYFGKTPSCSDRIIAEKFARIVIGTTDPNPRVCGEGIRICRNHNIEVTTGVLEKDTKNLIEFFDTYIRKSRAFLTVKYAQSIDGRIAVADGSSQWISSQQSLRFTHKLRDTHDVVMIGTGTLEIDDPLLTVRNIRGRNPVRIVVIGKKSIKPNRRMFHDNAARTIVVTYLDKPFGNEQNPGNVEIWRTEPDNDGKTSIKWILEKLSEEGLLSVLLEGGGKLLGEAISQNSADRIYAIVAPKIIGSAGVPSIDCEIASSIKDSNILKDIEYKKLGQDMVISARFRAND